MSEKSQGLNAWLAGHNRLVGCVTSLACVLMIWSVISAARVGDMASIATGLGVFAMAFATAAGPHGFAIVTRDEPVLGKLMPLANLLGLLLILGGWLAKLQALA